MYKNVPIIPLAVIGIVIAAITAAQALLIDWLPPAQSEQEFLSLSEPVTVNVDCS